MLQSAKLIRLLELAASPRFGKGGQATISSGPPALPPSGVQGGGGGGDGNRDEAWWHNLCREATEVMQGYATGQVTFAGFVEPGIAHILLSDEDMGDYEARVWVEDDALVVSMPDHGADEYRPISGEGLFLGMSGDDDDY